MSATSRSLLVVAALVCGGALVAAQLPSVIRTAAPPPTVSVDSTDPVTTITVPTSSATYDNGSSSTISIGGTATDNVQVATVTGSSDRTGSFSITYNLGDWTAAGISLSDGSNVLTVTTTDSSGRTHADTLTVTYSAPGGACDGSTTCMSALDDITPAVNQVITATGYKLVDEAATIAASFSYFRTGTEYGFEKGAAGADITNDGYGASSSQMKYSSTEKLMGTYSAMAHSISNVDCAQFGCGQAYNYFLPDYTDIYFRQAWKDKLATDGATGGPDQWPLNYSKLIYDIAGGSDYIIDTQGAGLASYWTTFLFQQYGGFSTSVGNGSLAEDEWTWLECHWKVTTTTVYQCWRNDTSLINRTTNTASRVFYVSFGVINAGSTGGNGWDFYRYVDNFIVSTARIYPSTMVELCNSATYAGATCVYQPPTSINDTSVSFKFKKGALPSGTGYIHLRSNSQVQAAPITVTIP